MNLIQVLQNLLATQIADTFAALTKLLLPLLVALGLSGCAGGTAADGKLSVEESVAMFEQTIKVLKENRVAGQVNISYDGDGAVYAKQSFGLDTGIKVSASVQMNATEGKALP